MKLQNVWMYQPSITLDNELSEYPQRSCAQTYQLVMQVVTSVRLYTRTYKKIR